MPAAPGTRGYAARPDYGDNALDFDLAYEFVEFTATWRPLSSLHKFQGWADKFLTTPANGIEDLYATGTVNLKGVAGGWLDTVGLIASYHDYETEAISADYGSEWNASMAAKHKRISLLLKYADYQQYELASARTTSKLWAQLEFVW